MGGWHLLTVTILGMHVQDRLSEGHWKLPSMSITYSWQVVWRWKLHVMVLFPVLCLPQALPYLLVWPDTDFKIIFTKVVYSLLCLLQRRWHIRPLIAVPLLWESRWGSVLMVKFTQRLKAVTQVSARRRDPFPLTPSDLRGTVHSITALKLYLFSFPLWTVH